MSNRNKRCFFVLTAILLLFSCNKKEVFSPNKYIVSESFQSGSSDFEAIKRFVYSEKNQLVSVWLKENNTTLTFDYNKDKTINKITSSENNGTNYALLSYDNQLVTQIKYYEKNELAQESLFFRKEKKNTINKIEYYVYDGFSAKEKSVLADLLFAEVKTMPESVRKSHKSGRKSLYSVQNITYEGDNIFRVRLSYIKNGAEEPFSITTYNYDDKKNPYYGLPYAFTGLTGYSKNNVTFARTSRENDPLKTMITIENKYSYEKKFPTYNAVTESETYIVGYDTLKNPIFTTVLRYYSYRYGY